MLGEPNCGQHIKSIESSTPTGATVSDRRPPVVLYRRITHSTISGLYGLRAPGLAGMFANAPHMSEISASAISR